MGNQLLIGAKYGHLTVLEEAPRGKHHERRYICQCDCGNIGSFDVANITRNPEHRCRKCVPHSGGYKRPDIVGKVVNGWEILADNFEHQGPAHYFTCRCTRCGNISVKSTGQLTMSKSNRCDKCTPMYDFVVKDQIAIGHLPDGTEFIIDKEDIPKVKRYYWRSGKDGYIVGGDNSIFFHRFIAEVDDPKVMVDHINRNRRDCRKANLREISPFGNSCNHSMFKSNKTGYIGVYFSKHSGRYEVKVGYNNKRIKLGSSTDDLVTLAQMYNIGALYLFGEYTGVLNDVPDPPEYLVKTVIEKCKKHKEASEMKDASSA